MHALLFKHTHTRTDLNHSRYKSKMKKEKLTESKKTREKELSHLSQFTTHFQNVEQALAFCVVQWYTGSGTSKQFIIM